MEEGSLPSGSHAHAHAHPHALSQNQNQNAMVTLGSSVNPAAVQHSEAILREAGSPETNVFYEQVRLQKSHFMFSSSPFRCLL